MFTNELVPGRVRSALVGTRPPCQRPDAGLLLRLLLLLRFFLVLVVLVQRAAGGAERRPLLAADDGAAGPSDDRALELAVLLRRGLLRSRALRLRLFFGESGAGRRRQQKGSAEQRRADPLRPRNAGHGAPPQKRDPETVLIVGASRMPAPATARPPVHSPGPPGG